MKHDHLVFTVVLMASISGPLSGQESVPESRAIGTGDSLHPRWQSFEPTYREHACPFPTAGFSDRPVSCGYVLVPEDRTDADSRLISLSVAKLSAIAGPWPAQAVVFLNGGPGGATLDELGERSGTFATGLPLPESEVILFDQRGTGYSDSEFCRGIRPSSRIGVAAAELRYRAALKRCLDEARTRGIAIDAYSTWHNALDIRDLRRAMSYDEWNLWGLSYGTRLARAALDVDPEGIRSVILDSVSPAEFPIGFAEAFRSALDAVGSACSEQTRCAAEVGDLDDRLIAVMAAYEENPLVLTLDSGSAQTIDVVVDGNRIADTLFSLLYRAEAYADLPILLQLLEARDVIALGSFARLLLEEPGPALGYGSGMSLVTRCRWHVPDTDTAERWQAGEPELSTWTIAPGWGANLGERCEHAYRIAPDPAVIEMPSLVPALLLAGRADPITPPAFAQATQSGLANAQLIEFPNIGHAVHRTLERLDRGCGESLLAGFIENPAAEIEPPCPGAYATPEYLTRVHASHRPVVLIGRIREGKYPVVPIIAIASLSFALFAYPVAALGRRVDRRRDDGKRRVRILTWTGVVLGLTGVAVTALAFYGFMRNHPLAMLQGLPGWVIIAGWLCLLGAVSTCASAIVYARLWQKAERSIGTAIGTAVSAVAAVAVLWFVVSIGAGPV